MSETSVPEPSAPEPSAPEPSPQPSFAVRARAFAPFALDIVVPVAGYFLLAALGVPDTWALTLAGLVTGLRAVYVVIRNRRIDGLAILIALELVLSAVLLAVTDDPRMILLKPSFYTLAAAGYLFFSVFVGQPVVYQAATPMATGGDPVRAEAYRRAWDHSAEFRRRERLVTAAFGAALALEAVLRGVVVLETPVSKVGESVLAGQVPGVVLIVAALFFARSQVPALSRVVDAEQAQLTQAA
jgi:hypothetical protein